MSLRTLSSMLRGSIKVYGEQSSTFFGNTKIQKFCACGRHAHISFGGPLLVDSCIREHVIMLETRFLRETSTEKAMIEAQTC